MNARSWTLFIIFAGLALRAAGMFTLPLMDPSEGRYAAAALEMHENGDWLTPRVYVQGKAVPYLGKPPLELWLANVSMHAGGIHPFWLRLPDFLSVLLMLGFVYFVLKRFDGKATALRAVLFCASAPAFLVLAGIAMPDVLLASAVAAAYCASYAFLRETEPRLRKRWSLLLFLFAAVGFMIKGPVALVYLALPALVWTIRWRRWETLRHHAWFTGLLGFLLLAAPWFVACEVANPGFLHYFFIQENLMRFLSKEYGDLYGQGHQQYLGAALVYTVLLAFPWSGVALYSLATRAGRDATKAAPHAAEKSFFWYVVIANSLFWCLSRNYLPTYLLPAVPAFCIWAAMQLEHRGRAEKRAVTVAALCFCLVIIALAAVPFVKPDISSLAVGTRALELAPGGNGAQRFAWVRKIPNSAFFYFRDHVVSPPATETLDAVLPWFNEHAGLLFVSDEKYLRKLPEAFHSRVVIQDRVGKWTLFRLTP